MSQTHNALSSQQNIIWSQPQRAAQFEQWLAGISKQHNLQPDTLRLASHDASFRRYFRLNGPSGSRIIMDAPPERESCQSFVKVAQLMRQAQILVPDILAWDEEQGFMLLTDLGQQTMLQAIEANQAQTNLALYQQALQIIIRWQLASRPDVLPPYDENILRRELEQFVDWYLIQYKQLHIDKNIRLLLDDIFNKIIANNLKQAQVFVHRDFMPRNLMVLPVTTTNHPVLALLDFQDALYGPISYDIASLMRDAFLSWDEEFFLEITIRYWQQARQAGLPVDADFGEFYRQVEWMGLQRHLKITGIFARLTLRDGKKKYLEDTPRFIGYIYKTCSRYQQLKPLLRLLEKVENMTTIDFSVIGR